MNLFTLSELLCCPSRTIDFALTHRYLRRDVKCDSCIDLVTGNYKNMNMQKSNRKLMDGFIGVLDAKKQNRYVKIPYLQTIIFL